MINSNLSDEQLDKIIKNVLHSEVEHIKIPERIKKRIKNEIINRLEGKNSRA